MLGTFPSWIICFGHNLPNRDIWGTINVHLLQFHCLIPFNFSCQLLHFLPLSSFSPFLEDWALRKGLIKRAVKVWFPTFLQHHSSCWHQTSENPYLLLRGITNIIIVTWRYIVTRLWGCSKIFEYLLSAKPGIYCCISPTMWVIFPSLFQIRKPRQG